jgi:hypothetical protein
MWKEAQAKCWESVPTKVTEGMNQVFIRPITLEEVKEVFMALPQGKAPHIDGIPTKFLQENLDATSKDIWKAITKMLDSENMPMGLNISLIILIPKIENRSQIGNWQPITFFNNVYKILAKFLAKYLQKLLPYIFWPNQTKFMARRNIVDNSFLAQEAMEWVVHSKHDFNFTPTRL